MRHPYSYVGLPFHGDLTVPPEEPKTRNEFIEYRAQQIRNGLDLTNPVTLFALAIALGDGIKQSRDLLVQIQALQIVRIRAST